MPLHTEDVEEDEEDDTEKNQTFARRSNFEYTCFVHGNLHEPC